MTSPHDLITDPVCGMSITAASAVVIEYRGRTYHFCESACAETFRDDPERWVVTEKDPAPTAT